MRDHDGTDLKKLMCSLAVGKVKEQPFDPKIIEEVRADLRIACKETGHGHGLPKEGDLVQAFEIRLIESLLSAFEDPDWYFCSWWARGVWIGSPTRKLPRASAIFPRKLRWRKYEVVDSLHAGWQPNYSSIAVSYTHLTLPTKQAV